ncbi:MAG: TIGR00266 family protein [Planctomycetes bacterium]|nr:TIGR00266 family protein [Planctomycetota bacterium]
MTTTVRLNTPAVATFDLLEGDGFTRVGGAAAAVSAELRRVTDGGLVSATEAVQILETQTAGSYFAIFTPLVVGQYHLTIRHAATSAHKEFVFDVEGDGDLLFNAYGAIVERELDGELTVDTGHVVAWEPTLDYSIEGMGGLKQTFFSGEGLVMRFSGQGKLWLQTRTLGETAGWITPYLRA